MNLSRKWLHEFVDLQDVSDREFSDAMTLSGSKVETVILILLLRIQNAERLSDLPRFLQLANS